MRSSTRAGTPPWRWDRIDELGLDPRQRAGKLSGGQKAQLALTLALAKRPELLILDEPVASLDPLARREFLQDLMGHVADNNTSVVLSSHLVADLERSCDYLIVLCASRVRIAGEVEHLLATHHRLTGPRRDPATLPAQLQVITASHTERQSTLIVRTDAPIHDPAWTVEQLTLEDLVLAYMSEASTSQRKCDGQDWRQRHDLVDLAAVPHPVDRHDRRAGGDRAHPGHHRPAPGAPVPHRYRWLPRTQRQQLLLRQTLSAFTNTDSFLQHFFGFALIIIPGLIGAFWGAPLDHPRNRGWHPPADLEPERHPNPMAER